MTWGKSAWVHKHNAEHLRKRHLCQEWKKLCVHLEICQSQLYTTKAFCSPPSTLLQHRLIWTAVRKSAILPWRTFFLLPWQRAAEQPLQAMGVAKKFYLSDWPEIPFQGFALPLSYWDELTSPCFCKNYQGFMQTPGYAHSSHHTLLLRMAAWWKRKQNLTVHHVMKLKGFNVPTHEGPIQTCLSLELMLALHTMSK